MDASWPAPVAMLATLGFPGKTDSPKINYLELGLSQEHVPELVAMASDKDLYQARRKDAGTWTALHAWRALWQLRSAEIVPVLLDWINLIEDLDNNQLILLRNDLLETLSMLDELAIRKLARYVANPKLLDITRHLAAEGLKEIGRKHHDARPACILALERELARYSRNNRTLNGFLVEKLMELDAVESLPTIRQAYQDNAVSLLGFLDIEQVELAFGVRTELTKPHPSFSTKRKKAKFKGEFMRPLAELMSDKTFVKFKMVEEVFVSD